MTTAFINTTDFNWWWLLAVPVVLVAAFFLYRRLIRVERFRNRKLTVCIALSVLAHLLLLSGAYMADMFKVPDLAGDGSIRFSLDETTDDNPVASDQNQTIPTLNLTTENPNAGDVNFEPTSEPSFDEPNFDTPDFDTPDFDTDATQFETPEFDPTPNNDTSSDATQFETPDFEPDAADSANTTDDDGFEALVAESNNETQFETPEFDPTPTTTPQPEPKVAEAAPSFEEPSFEEPSFDEPFVDTAPANDTTTTAPDPTTSLAQQSLAQQPAPKFTPPPASPPQQNLAQNTRPDPWQQPQTADSTPSSDLVPVRRTPRTASNTNRYQLRTAPDRMAQVRKRGGSADTEAAVAAALKWLANNQSADGRWDADRHQAGRDNAVDGHYRNGAGRESDTGITGLAILAFLGNGQTHQKGEYRETVAKGLEFLMGQQGQDGSLAGESLYYARTYCHSIATLALSEAYAMTSDDRMRDFVERAVAFSIRTQQPVTGGWRYRPGQIGDMSQFGWQVMALTSADQAGIALRAEDRHLMSRFLRTVSTGRFGGLSSYRPNHGPSRTMTAEGLVCRVFLGQTADRTRLTEAADYVATQPPSTGPMNLYYWYYGTMAMYQYGGQHWEKWNDGLKQRLLPTQIIRGPMTGSWQPNTVWSSYGGRVYSTAMAALCLEVYYRYLPLISTDRVATRP